MPDMDVDRLVLRLSGGSAEEGRQLALALSRRLASGMGAMAWEGIGDATLERVRATTEAAPGAAAETLAERAADEVLRQLRRTL